MKYYILLLFFLSPFIGLGQTKPTLPSPVEIPLILAGTFGELRSNHFHSGIDIKTQQRQGIKAIAIADGYVSRIKISEWGYGKALYITHTNGYTSVYAHLQKFAPEIERYVRTAQYKKEQYEIELFPSPETLPITSGNLVAYTGNTGSSAGPHLHFEIRETRTEKPTNPLQYGLQVADATSPTILNVYAYPISDSTHINQQQSKVQLALKKQADGSYITNTIDALGTIGLGIEAYDRQDLAANKNGLFSVSQKVNGKEYTNFDVSDFSFGETRYINTLIDYDHFGRYNKRIQRLFRVENNRLSIYNTLVNDGKIVVKEGLQYQVEITLADYNKNTTRIIVPVTGTSKVSGFTKQTTNNTYVIAKKPSTFDLGGAKVYFPANTFYENVYLDLQKGKDTVTIHRATIPAHRNFTLTFDVAHLSDSVRKQAFIGRLQKYGPPSFVKTYKRGDTFTARTKDLGSYTIAIDTLSPKIRSKNFKNKQWLNNYQYLRLSLTDDFSGVASYRGKLNGKWILLEYEPKTNTLTYNFNDTKLESTTCVLEIIATDNVGNTTTFNSKFYRK